MRPDKSGRGDARLKIGGLELDFVLLARLGAVLTALLSAAYLLFFSRR